MPPENDPTPSPDPAPVPAPPAPPAPAGDEPKFTQADLDAAVQKRLGRENLADLKAKAAELDKIRASSATDEEKRAAELDQVRKEAAAEATAKANTRVVAAEVRAAAVAAQFHDPADALARLGSKLADIEVGDDGTVDGKAVDKLVADLAAAAPHLVKTPAGPPSPGAAGIGTGAGTPGGRPAPASLGDAVTKHYTQS